MQTKQDKTKGHHEVKYTLPVAVLEKFKLAAEVAGMPLNEFIKQYSLKCMSVDPKTIDKKTA